VDAVDARIALALEAELQRPGEIVVDRRGQRHDLVAAEVGRETERREPGRPEDLVRVRAADPRDRALVAEEGVELPAVAAQDLAQCGLVDVERVGPEVRQLGVQDVGSDEPDARPLLLASLGEVELAAVCEAHLEHRLGGGFLPRRDIPQPAGAHQVDAEDELAVGGREEEVLPTPPRSLERAAGERGGRRVERLQCGDVSRPRDLDRRAGDERVELPHPCLDLG
jgi:hypothetical protein